MDGDQDELDSLCSVAWTIEDIISRTINQFSFFSHFFTLGSLKRRRKTLNIHACLSDEIRRKLNAISGSDLFVSNFLGEGEDDRLIFFLFF